MTSARPASTPGGRPESIKPPTRRAAWPLWEDRSAQWLSPRQLQVQVPMIGAPFAPTFGYAVGLALLRTWELRRLEGDRVEAVAVHCSDDDDQSCLIVLVTFTELPASLRPIDGLQMSRDLRSAIRGAAQESAAHRPVDVIS